MRTPRQLSDAGRRLLRQAESGAEPSAEEWLRLCAKMRPILRSSSKGAVERTNARDAEAVPTLKAHRGLPSLSHVLGWVLGELPRRGAGLPRVGLALAGLAGCWWLVSTPAARVVHTTPPSPGGAGRGAELAAVPARTPAPLARESATSTEAKFTTPAEEAPETRPPEKVTITAAGRTAARHAPVRQPSPVEHAKRADAVIPKPQAVVPEGGALAQSDLSDADAEERIRIPGPPPQTAVPRPRVPVPDMGPQQAARRPFQRHLAMLALAERQRSVSHSPRFTQGAPVARTGGDSMEAWARGLTSYGLPSGAGGSGAASAPSPAPPTPPQPTPS